MRHRIFALLVALALVLPGLALAQEGEHGQKPPPAGQQPPPGNPNGPGVLAKEGGESKEDLAGDAKGEEAPRLDIRALGVQLLGFTILAIILLKFAGPPAMKALRARTERIRHDLDALDHGEKDVADAKAAAEKSLREIEAGSVERMERAVKEGGELRQALLREGDEGAEKVRYKARLEAEIERQKMLLELRNEVVELSFDAAERVLAGGAVDAKTQAKLVDDFIDNLETVSA